MAGIEDILDSLPIDDIASRLVVDPAVAKKAVQEGGATILSGLQHNAQTPEGSAAIEKALGAHAGQSDNVDLNTVDTADGQKILGHIFGDQDQDVAQQLTDAPSTAGIDFGKLLPMLAPIVMGLLAKNQPGGSQESAGSSGGGIADVIGGLLGGGSAPGAQSPGGSSGGGIDIGGIIGGLGGLFGGKS